MEQVYSRYTPQDQKIWKILFDRQIKLLQHSAAREYLKALRTIGFSDTIPRYTELNQQLTQHTGWSIHVVPGLIEVDKFFKLLSQRKFSASTWLRGIDQLDYLQEPDMFHDIFGHIPLITNPFYADFMQAFGAMGVKYYQYPQAVKMLQNLYWYTIEFGLIKENGNTRIYGAGILSSPEETAYSLSDKPKHYPFDLATIFDTDFYIDRLQEHYFVIESLEQLFNSIEEMEKMMEERCKAMETRS